MVNKKIQEIQASTEEQFNKLNNELTKKLTDDLKKLNDKHDSMMKDIKSVNQKLFGTDTVEGAGAQNAVYN